MKITVVMATLLFDVIAKHGKQKVKIIYSKCNPNLTFLFTTVDSNSSCNEILRSDETRYDGFCVLIHEMSILLLFK